MQWTEYEWVIDNTHYIVICRTVLSSTIVFTHLILCLDCHGHTDLFDYIQNQGSIVMLKVTALLDN